MLIVATAQVAKFFDSGVTTAEQALGLVPYMRIGIQMPIWIIGIEPSTWTPIRERYDRMYEVATENGLTCHQFERVFGSVTEPAAPGIDEPLDHAWADEGLPPASYTGDRNST